MKKLYKKFGIYSAMGLASGVTFGATAADAEIIFTDFQGSASTGQALDIDLDADGTVDFIFDLQQLPNGYGSNTNLVALTGQGGNQFAAIDPSPYSGLPYGPNNIAYGGTIVGQNFAGGAGPLQLAYTSFNNDRIYGAFAGVNTGYIGVQFASGGGDTVFGWINVTVNGDVLVGNFADVAVDIDGFAFATAGTTIVAGQTTAIPEPSSIGLLALGAAGLATRRRRKSA